MIVSEPKPGYFEHEVIHDGNCPVKWFEGPFKEGGYSDYVCDVGIHVNWCGFMDLENDERMKKPGKYEIDWYGHFPTSIFEENEVYIYFVEEENAKI